MALGARPDAGFKLQRLGLRAKGKSVSSAGTDAPLFKVRQDAVCVPSNVVQRVVEQPDEIREPLEIASLKVLLGFRRVIKHLLGVAK